MQADEIKDVNNGKIQRLINQPKKSYTVGKYA